ncbi:MAG TPA: hypothetical protein VFV38_30170 [Ktedonobacteraceae bacterium]|nr:hypothetical protein [Ktedonobacteraceae bacterium]
MLEMDAGDAPMQAGAVYHLSTWQGDTSNMNYVMNLGFTYAEMTGIER